MKRQVRRVSERLQIALMQGRRVKRLVETVEPDQRVIAIEQARGQM